MSEVTLTPADLDALRRVGKLLGDVADALDSGSQDAAAAVPAPDPTAADGGTGGAPDPLAPTPPGPEPNAAGAPGPTFAATDPHEAELTFARTYVGTPYAYGGGHVDDGRAGIDCSGLLLQAARQAGASVTNDTADGLRQQTVTVDWPSVRDGDWFFFDWDGDGVADHCGIRTSFRHMLHAAAPGTMVQEIELTDYYLTHLMEARCPFGGHAAS
jgi:cell wall-associated NlpC family hydrolase